MAILNEAQNRAISEATFKKTAERGIRHAIQNAPYIKKTLKDLRKEIEAEVPKPAIVVSAGPSLKRRNSIEVIKKSDFKGYIVSVDGSLGQCLRKGLIPDFVVTVDPCYPYRMIRWFGDPQLRQRQPDDYFKHQDLDGDLNENEESLNEELVRLVNHHGPKIKVVISTGSNPEVTHRCLEAGMQLYWWNPLYDDFEKEDSISRQIYETNKVPCMVTGGNVGGSAWVFVYAVLESPEIILVGLDNSYPPGATVVNTQYFEYLKGIFPEEPEKGLCRVYNPYLKETWTTDPAYSWYNDIFLYMLSHSKSNTYNCTEGGILFGDGIEFIPLNEGLRRVENG
ncbi:MAG: DUF115 domain-containing protein [Planctomycetes bacterium]|nr:DUF115 domain-containing protein [Planctomycetota bacterium]